MPRARCSCCPRRRRRWQRLQELPQPSRNVSLPARQVSSTPTTCSTVRCRRLHQSDTQLRNWFGSRRFKGGSAAEVSGEESVKDHRDVIIRPGRLREVLRTPRGERLHLRGRPRCLEARDPRRRGVDLRRLGAQGEHAQPQGQAQARTALATVEASVRSPGRSGPVVTLAEGDSIDLFEA